MSENNENMMTDGGESQKLGGTLTKRLAKTLVKSLESTREFLESLETIEVRLKTKWWGGRPLGRIYRRRGREKSGGGLHGERKR